jgi:hypothetical protein
MSSGFISFLSDGIIHIRLRSDWTNDNMLEPAHKGSEMRDP